jgi:deoxyribodipyrimidine photo-lyase
VWWVRRDLRLFDNPALAEALAHAPTVLPLYILDPHILNASPHRLAHKRLAFLFGGLRQLDKDLRALGSRLVVRRGPPLEVLTRVYAESKAVVIVAAEDFSPYAQARDRLVAQHLPLRLVQGVTLRHPSAVVKPDGTPYRVFTPFRNAWLAQPMPSTHNLLLPPTRLNQPPRLASERLPPSSLEHFIPGELHARAALHRFTEPPDGLLYHYGDARNRLDADGTSALSPYLRFGMLSVREVVVTTNDAIAAAPHAAARQSAETWLSELIWREFFAAVLFHFPAVLRLAFRPARRHIAWANDPAAFAAWCEGRTGYPVVDAAMHQLAETGWMHNRARMIVASFLVKDLLIDWRWGEQWFMQHLVDGDAAVNNGNWQWVAGVGTDAAPYFRVFNPVQQSKQFDPHGDFARAWLPALKRVPDQYIHAPWTMPASVQRRADCQIGADYPAPIIDHAFARQRALAAYRSGTASD